MSTRAILAYANEEGRWKGVWNHGNGDTEALGQAILERVEELGGDLQEFSRRTIEECPGGWSDFAAGKRGAGGGVWSGSYRGERVVFERGVFPDEVGREPTRQLPDAHYLYLLDPSRRRLLVFGIAEADCAAFTGCEFDEAGKANPPMLAPTGRDTREAATEGADLSPSASTLIAAARKVLGDRALEIDDSDASAIALYVVVRAVEKPSCVDEVDVAKAGSLGIEAEEGDELLFPIHYLSHAEDHAAYQQTSGLARFLNLPSDVFQALRRALLEE